MKKFLFAAVLVVLATSFALAQGTVVGNTGYIPTVDNMGAHENGGRGCAGCHAPHSGGRGSGGNILGTSTQTGYGYTATGVAEGDTGIWGTDTNPIETGYAGGVITFAGSYPVTLANLTWASGSLYTGVVTCLSCHDGNVSKGAMMSGQAYEQSFGLLNFATNVGSNHQAAPVNLYGSQPIPTLLGNDGGVAGDYSNDHPIGPSANLGKVFSSYLAEGLTPTVSSSNKISFAATAGTPYGIMAATYGFPAIASMATTVGDTNPSDVYIVCTTCHNQHSMTVFKSSSSGGKLIASNATGRFQTIFFVNGPYNPGAPYDPTHPPSTMRFCQQCHFTMSNEYYGGTNIGTAF
jgi:hypothetical protein